jgi:hypothetical protein
LLRSGFRRDSRQTATPQALLPQALLLTVFARVCLWLLPFKTVRGVLLDVADHGSRCDHRADQIVRVVETASRCVPRATCLTQALAMEVLLRRSGIDCSLWIGVTEDAENPSVAHAWIESDGTVLCGNEQRDRFVPLVRFQGRSTYQP